jgi:hypothetical protein
MVDWFPRLADIPNVGYAGHPGMNRSRLPGQNAKPRVRVSTVDGRQHESIEWPSRDGGTSASPVDQHLSETTGDKAQSSEELLQRLREALELPGEPTDYHFAIQRCIEELWAWRRRREQPWLLAEIEQLCWLDIRLIEAMPRSIAFEHHGEQRFYAVAAFDHLIQLYEREGFVEEALDVARRATRFRPEFPKLQDLEQRAATLASETVG